MDIFERSIVHMLEHVGEDPMREGLKNTPSRVRKAFEFLCSGYNENIQEIVGNAIFSSTNTEMVIVRDIEFYSLCEHHLLPIIGKVHVAYIPNKKVIGLSKIPRIVNVFARRLQIQEQMTEQIAHTLMAVLEPKGVGVTVNARHMCIEMRGVQKINSTTVTSSMLGVFKTDLNVKNSFLQTL